MQRCARSRADDDFKHRIPVHVVWEITLACDLKCLHCGSRAGHPRPKELSTDECLDVVEQLARLGTREVSLIGGEAYLRRDWTEIVRAIRSHDIYCAIQTGGRNLTEQRLEKAIAAGLQGVGVSLDGLKSLHDRIRGLSGSFDKALDALRRAKAAGLNTSVNTHVGAQTITDLPGLMDVVLSSGAKQWQIQLTVPMGNAVDNDFLLIQPYQILELMPLLAELYYRAADQGLLLVMGNNVGYFGPYEHIWRGLGDARIHWTGCSAGQTVIALEADGTVKGCPSLPTVGYSGGDVRHLTIEKIWNESPELRFGHSKSVDELWGFCRTCYYADVCGGGCTWTSHSLLGRPGNNPYCHYRALELKKKGIQERVQKLEDAPGDSFAVGKFQLIEETQDGSTVVSSSPRSDLVTIRATHAAINRIPPTLVLCHACNCYIWGKESDCPHCGTSVSDSICKRAQEMGPIDEAKSRILRFLEDHPHA
jgi:Y-X(10)_GDL-associated radical SAM protein